MDFGVIHVGRVFIELDGVGLDIGESREVVDLHIQGRVGRRLVSTAACDDGQSNPMVDTVRAAPFLYGVSEGRAGCCNQSCGDGDPRVGVVTIRRCRMVTISSM